jgi:hypothetical protein
VLAALKGYKRRFASAEENSAQIVDSYEREEVNVGDVKAKFSKAVTGEHCQESQREDY